jgi:putative PIN family toxin of toxin-antitoxin system
LCSEILESVLQGHELLTCTPVLTELERVLLRKMRVPARVAADFVGLLRDQGEIVAAQTPPSVAIADADDVLILACAIGGKADFFVTGDKALLDLLEVDGVPIISPRELWIRLAGLHPE